MSALRPYQQKIIDEFEMIPDGERVVLVAPTGSGKTVMASAIIAGRVARYQNVLVLAHRREIVNQTVRKLAEHGVFAGTIVPDRTARACSV